MNRMRLFRLFGLIFAVILVLSSITVNTSAANAVVFKIESVKVAAGSSVATAAIDITENCGYAAADIMIVSSLEIKKIEAVGISPVSNISNGKVNWSNVKNNYKTGNILNVTFAVPDNSKPGDSWPVSIEITEIINEKLEPVSAEVKQGVVTVIPKTPLSPKAVSASYNSIKVSWETVAGATGYAVYRFNGATKVFYKLKVTSATSFTDTSLSTGKTYYYKVRAYKTVSGVNIYSGYSVTASSKPVPAIPGFFNAIKAGSTNIKLNWAAVTGATGYVVYRLNSTTKAYDRIKVTTATSCINTGLKTGVTFTYKVRAYKTVGKDNVYGKPSAAASAKTY